MKCVIVLVISLFLSALTRLQIMPNRNTDLYSLAYAELYLTVAILVRRFDFELYMTERKDVDIARDCFVGQSEIGSKGVRVSVKGERL